MNNSNNRNSGEPGAHSNGHRKTRGGATSTDGGEKEYHKGEEQPIYPLQFKPLFQLNFWGFGTLEGWRCTIRSMIFNTILLGITFATCVSIASVFELTQKDAKDKAIGSAMLLFWQGLTLFVILLATNAVEKSPSLTLTGWHKFVRSLIFAIMMLSMAFTMVMSVLSTWQVTAGNSKEKAVLATEITLAGGVILSALLMAFSGVERNT